MKHNGYGVFSDQVAIIPFLLLQSLISAFLLDSSANLVHAFRRYTDKSDIYSFGMILGVLLTGKDPSDPFFAGETGRGSLGRWVRHLQQVGEARQALDEAMLGEELEEEQMLMAIRIAIVCMSDLPADRPSSDELVAMLTQLHSF